MFPGSKKQILDDDAQHRVVSAIKEAESRTTGEIRVFIENRCKYMDAMHRAKELFTKLGMHKTEHHNAIIVYLAIKDRQYAIFGDVAIFEKAGGAFFWEKAAAQLKNYLKNNQVTEGLCICINELGIALAQHFPFDAAVPKNELPDEIVFGK